MSLHAIEVKDETLPIITALNYGVTPIPEKKPTYFIFDTDMYSNFGEHIISEVEFLAQYDSYDGFTVFRIE